MSVAVAKAGHAVCTFSGQPSLPKTDRFQVLFSSHLNSLAGHLNLLETCNCNYAMRVNGVEISDILAARKMTMIAAPELDDVLSVQDVPHIPFTKSTHETHLILHTSGSTGFPKPININMDRLAVSDILYNYSIDTDPRIAPQTRLPIGRQPGRALYAFAPFHGIVTEMVMCATVYAQTTMVLNHPSSLLNPQSALDAIEYFDLKNAYVPPAYLDAWVKDEKALKKLERLDQLGYAGGETESF